MARGIRNIAVMVGMFLLFAGAVGIAGAQRSTEQSGEPQRDPGVAAAAEQRQGPRGPFGEMMDEFASRLAAKLGVSEDALRSAFRETMEELRPQMRERMQGARERMRHWRERDDGEGRPGRPGGDGPPGFGMRRDGPGPMEGGPGMMGGGPGVPPPVLGLSADILHMQPDALRQELEAGKTLAQVGQDHGVTADALADQIVTRMEQMRMQHMREMVRGALDRQQGQR